MDLDAVAEELYAASPDEFVERRSAAVARARAAKDRGLVKAVGQLRRPTRSAWLVNLLAREATDEVDDWLALGGALGQAQQRSDGPELRRLARERQLGLARLTRKAAALGAEHDHQATEQSRQEVGQTLQAALADPAVAGLVRTGRLTQAASYGGFGPLLPTLSLVPAVPEAPPTTAAPDSTAPDPTAPELAAPDPAEQAREQVRVEREAARAELAAADRALEEVRETLAAADRLAADATARADRLAEEVEGLRTRLAEAEAEERTARDQAREVRRTAARQQQARTEAEEERARREQALAALEAAGPR